MLHNLFHTCHMLELLIPKEDSWRAIVLLALGTLATEALTKVIFTMKHPCGREMLKHKNK